MATVLNNFKPDEYSSTLIQELRSNLVYAQPGVVNSRFAGQVGINKTVTIYTQDRGTIRDYDPNVDIVAPELISVQERELSIDQLKYFHFYLDDVDRREILTDLLASQAEIDGRQLAEFADSHVRDVMRLGAGISVANGDNVDGDGLTPANVFNYFLKLKTLFTRQNIPAAGRFAIIPPELSNILVKSEMVNEINIEGNFRTAVQGNIAGFTLIESNQVFEETLGAAAGDFEAGDRVFHLAVGLSEATHYADAINETIAYAPERRFGTAVKGLHVYGADMYRPEVLANARVSIDPAALA